MSPGPSGDLSSLVAEALGLDWAGSGPDELAGLALRENPRRAQLVVSTVLGKHLPVPGEAAEQAGHALGRAVAALLAGPDDEQPGPLARPPGPVVLGYCETATALGALVAEQLPGSSYVHTTRRPDPLVPVLGGFEEEHSHATSHALQPRDRRPLEDPARPLVLVDDELTSGTTVLNTLAALPPHEVVVVAALLDLRPAAAREELARRAPHVRVVALRDGALAVPDDVMARAAALRLRLREVPPAPVPAQRGEVVEAAGLWPQELPATARCGLSAAGRAAQHEAAAALVDALAPRLGERVLVLGTEELMRVPLRVAALLGDRAVVHSTTRSPVLAADVDGYAVRRALVFPAPDEPGRESRLHGLPDEPYDDVVLLVDAPDWGPLAQALRPWATGAVHAVAL